MAHYTSFMVYNLTEKVCRCWKRNSKEYSSKPLVMKICEKQYGLNVLMQFISYYLPILITYRTFSAFIIFSPTTPIINWSLHNYSAHSFWSYEMSTNYVFMHGKSTIWDSTTVVSCSFSISKSFDFAFVWEGPLRLSVCCRLEPKKLERQQQKTPLGRSSIINSSSYSRILNISYKRLILKQIGKGDKIYIEGLLGTN